MPQARSRLSHHGLSPISGGIHQRSSSSSGTNDHHHVVGCHHHHHFFLEQFFGIVLHDEAAVIPFCHFFVDFIPRAAFAPHTIGTLLPRGSSAWHSVLSLKARFCAWNKMHVCLTAYICISDKSRGDSADNTILQRRFFQGDQTLR